MSLLLCCQSQLPSYRLRSLERSAQEQAILYTILLQRSRIVATAEEAPCNRDFGCTSKDPRVVEINLQSSAGACQMRLVGLAQKEKQI